MILPGVAGTSPSLEPEKGTPVYQWGLRQRIDGFECALKSRHMGR